jgi:hypothetical protein
MKFCRDYNIEYSPKTIGQNVFYRGGLGGVQISFGSASYKEVPLKEDGTHNWDAVLPPQFAREIIVQSFYQRNLASIAETFKDIQREIGGSGSKCDPELEPYLK